MQACILFIAIIFFSTEIKSSVDFINIPFELFSLIILPDTILKINRVHTHFYYLSFFTDLYQEFLKKKAMDLCIEKINHWNDNLSAPRYGIFKGKNKKNKKSGKYLLTLRRWNNLRTYYFSFRKECFIYHAHKTTFKPYTIKSHFDDFQKNNKDSVTYQTNHRDIHNTEKKVDFFIYTLVEKNKKVVLVHFPNVKNWDASSNVWLSEINQDDSVVRVVLTNYNFRGYKTNFLSHLKNTILYKIIIQDNYANTLFHEACLSKNFDEIKKFSPCYFDVLDKNKKRGIDLISFDASANNEILKYLIEKQVKQGNELTNREKEKFLPSAELKQWYKTIVKN